MIQTIQNLYRVNHRESKRSTGQVVFVTFSLIQTVQNLYRVNHREPRKSKVQVVFVIPILRGGWHQKIIEENPGTIYCSR
jgi:hypothetical protein